MTSIHSQLDRAYSVRYRKKFGEKLHPARKDRYGKIDPAYDPLKACDKPAEGISPLKDHYETRREYAQAAEGDDRQRKYHKSWNDIYVWEIDLE